MRIDTPKRIEDGCPDCVKRKTSVRETLENMDSDIIIDLSTGGGAKPPSEFEPEVYEKPQETESGNQTDNGTDKESKTDVSGSKYLSVLLFMGAGLGLALLSQIGKS